MNASDNPASNNICSECVGENFLKALIESNGKAAGCFYCNDEAKTISVNELANRIEQAFKDHYERTPTEPEGIEAAMYNDKESNYCWERHGEEVKWAIARAAQIDEKVAIDIVTILEDRHADFESAQMGLECDFAKNSYYAEKNPGCEEFRQNWNEFEKGLKSEARFFSKSAQTKLDDIFVNLFTLKTNKGASIVINIGPEAETKFLYRARVFAGEDHALEEALKYPWKHLGPPPMHVASAGRMNARGISVFYGAIESATALAEVRPPVGSTVVVAKFIITRPLRLLDVAALKSVTIPGSIFDPKFLSECQRANFMEILSARISRPVMPNEEALEYLATQAVADYLANETKLDGIIFPSVQVGQPASNVVLFHHASRVVETQLPEGTDVSFGIQQDEDDVPDYVVWEVVFPPLETPIQKELDPFFDITPIIFESADIRPDSLKTDLNNITVHHVSSVKFAANEYPVARHRFVKPPT